MDSANEILPSIPKEQRNKVATFLEGRGSYTTIHLTSFFLNNLNNYFSLPQT